MFEMSSTGEYHCDAELVARVDYLLVANAAARLHNVFDAVFVACLNAVLEWEERVRDKH